MRKHALFIICFVLLSISVLGLDITPETQDVSVFTNSAENAYVNLTNNGDKPLYSVSLSASNSDISFIDNDFDLGTNQTKQVKMIISTSATYTETLFVDVIYYERVDVTLQPTEDQISINNGGFDPNDKEVVEGSTIVWTNNDTISHSVTCDRFDVELQPGEQHTYVFSDVGIINYYDKFTNYNGKITILGKQGEDYAHNPNDDLSFALNVNSKKVETTLSIQLIDGDNFTVESNRQKDSVLLVENTGDSTAQSISFKGEWITYGKSDFYLSPGDKTYVTFTISPQIMSSTETNQTYTKQIIAYSNNTLDVNQNISIFVPYMSNVSVEDTVSEFFNNTLDDDFLMALHNMVCLANPEYTYCTPEIKEVVVYRSPPINVNYSTEDVHNMFRKQADIYNKVERSDKEMNKLISQLNEESTTTRDATVEMKRMVEQLMENQDDSDSQIDTISYIILIIFLVVIMILGGWIGMRKLKVYIEDHKAART